MLVKLASPGVMPQNLTLVNIITDEVAWQTITLYKQPKAFQVQIGGWNTNLPGAWGFEALYFLNSEL